MDFGCRLAPEIVGMDKTSLRSETLWKGKGDREIIPKGIELS